MFGKRRRNSQNLNSDRGVRFLKTDEVDNGDGGCRNKGGNGRRLGLANRNRKGNRQVDSGNFRRMNRRGPRKRIRNISGVPIATYFKPNGISVSELEIINLDLDEFEALRLKNVKDLDQTSAAEEMNISQSTFARILDSAYKKISMALINGHAIEIKS